MPVTRAGWIAPLRRSLRLFCREQRAVALVELALVTPLLVMAGLWTVELTNYVIVKQRISAVARMTSDNASRMGENSPLQQKQVTEADIRDALTGAEEQSVKLNLRANGRVILSSLERNASGGQWIHWQRCLGAQTWYNSTHGTEGDGAVGTAFPGMGDANPKAKAPANSAIMFVEVAYNYKPLVPLFGQPSVISDTAANLIRERRDLSRTYNPDGISPNRC